MNPVVFEVKRSFEVQPLALDKLDIRSHFLSSSFTEFSGLVSPQAQPKFTGILNLANEQGVGRSLAGTVHRGHQHPTVLSE